MKSQAGGSRSGIDLCSWLDSEEATLLGLEKYAWYVISHIILIQFCSTDKEGSGPKP